MKHRTRYHRLRALFQIAVSLAAGRAYGCGPCPGPTTTLVPYLPDGNGPDAGAEGRPGSIDELDCRRQCGSDVSSCKLTGDAVGGTPIVECTTRSECGAGRRPAGYTPEPFEARSALGTYYAEMALLERASVPAFCVLYTDLAQLGAPRSLLERTKKAIADERAHTRIVGRLARTHGARLPRARRTRAAPPSRSVVDIATENAVEGCARETFAALVASFQAAHASPELRATFTRIARDETRHAALSHDVHTFLLTKLAPRERQQVTRAYEAALDALGASGLGLPEDTRAHLGLPTREDATRLAEALRDGLADLEGAPQRASRKKTTFDSSIPARPHVPSA